MNFPSDSPAAPELASDPFDLNRFVRAQQGSYDSALAELRAGRKRTHWMWFIFPQIDGLAWSETARRFAIKSEGEARAYLAHPLLWPRLLECAEAALRIEGRSAREIFGSPDDLKLLSCATLFAAVCDAETSAETDASNVFERLITRYYPTGRDLKTLQLLASSNAN